ncbi:MAG: hypothetical protein FJZ96_01225 [Chloroflexi bacterium]|nr:hypothetical protein [Chloroflexota bacterium]
MSKRSIIEQVQAQGAVAAHTTGRYVDIAGHVPVRVTMATPIYKARDKFRKGDRVAIIDMDENVAFICIVSGVELGGLSRTPTLTLDRARKIRLE